MSDWSASVFGVKPSEIIEGQIVVWGLAGTILAGAAVAVSTVACVLCNRRCRQMYDRCWDRILGNRDDYRRLQEEEEAHPMDNLGPSTQSGSKQDVTSSGDIETGTIPKPRRSVDKSGVKEGEDASSEDIETGTIRQPRKSVDKSGQQKKKDKQRNDGDTTVDVEQGRRPSLRRMLSGDKTGAGKED